MQYLEILFIYTISCSTLLFFGIGLEKAFFASSIKSAFSPSLPSFFINALLSVTILWFLVNSVLLPQGLESLVPMLSVFICGIIQVFISLVIPRAYLAPTGEKLFLFGTVLLALYQADSFISSLVIVCASLISFSLLSVILFAIRDRIASGRPRVDWKGAPLVLISLGLLFLALYSADVSWWLQEAYR
jgi:Na+-translocating ferredoxin:NAD+ oxidoreductase RnfA subunit